MVKKKIHKGTTERLQHLKSLLINVKSLLKILIIFRTSNVHSSEPCFAKINGNISKLNIHILKLLDDSIITLPVF